MKKVTGREIIAVVLVAVVLGALYVVSNSSAATVKRASAATSGQSDGVIGVPSPVNQTGTDPDAQPTDASTQPYALDSVANSLAAPDFSLKTLDGKRVTLADAVKHGPVVLDIWATYCQPCKMELAELEHINAQYRSRGVQILAVNGDASTAQLNHFFSKNQLTYPVLVDEPDLNVTQSYAVSALPSTFIIDTHQRIRSSMVGYDPSMLTDMSASLDQLLKEN